MRSNDSVAENLECEEEMLGDNGSSVDGDDERNNGNNCTITMMEETEEEEDAIIHENASPINVSFESDDGGEDDGGNDRVEDTDCSSSSSNDEALLEDAARTTTATAVATRGDDDEEERMLVYCVGDSVSGARMTRHCKECFSPVRSFYSLHGGRALNARLRKLASASWCNLLMRISTPLTKPCHNDEGDPMREMRLCQARNKERMMTMYFAAMSDSNFAAESPPFLPMHEESVNERLKYLSHRQESTSVCSVVRMIERSHELWNEPYRRMRPNELSDICSCRFGVDCAPALLQHLLFHTTVVTYMQLYGKRYLHYNSWHDAVVQHLMRFSVEEALASTSVAFIIGQWLPAIVYYIMPLLRSAVACQCIKMPCESDANGTRSGTIEAEFLSPFEYMHCDLQRNVDCSKRSEIAEDYEIANRHVTLTRVCDTLEQTFARLTVVALYKLMTAAATAVDALATDVSATVAIQPSLSETIDNLMFPEFSSRDQQYAPCEENGHHDNSAGSAISALCDTSALCDKAFRSGCYHIATILLPFANSAAIATTIDCVLAERMFCEMVYPYMWSMHAQTVDVLAVAVKFICQRMKLSVRDVYGGCQESAIFRFDDSQLFDRYVVACRMICNTPFGGMVDKRQVEGSLTLAARNSSFEFFKPSNARFDLYCSPDMTFSSDTRYVLHAIWQKKIRLEYLPRTLDRQLCENWIVERLNNDTLIDQFFKSYTNVTLCETTNLRQSVDLYSLLNRMYRTNSHYHW